MKLSSVLLLFAAPFLVSAAPAESGLTARQGIDTSTHCGDWDVVQAGKYALLLNLWGKGGATSGQQCANLISLSGDTVSWRVNWTWVGGDGVKSYTNIQLNQGVNKQLSAIQSIPTTWRWSQSTSGSIVANVAYDLWTSNTAGGSNVNEIMIWLANFNAGPISFQYDAQGNPVPVARSVSLAGRTWNVYSGSNGANNVFSFLPTSGQITSFSADLKPFLTWLTQNQGVSASQYLTIAQAGTEPTRGSAVLTTSAYSLAIN